MSISLDQPILGNKVDAIARTSLLSENGSESNCFCALGSIVTCAQIIMTPVGPAVHYQDCSLAKPPGCKESLRGCGAFYDGACDGNKCGDGIIEN